MASNVHLVYGLYINLFSKWFFLFQGNLFWYLLGLFCYRSCSKSPLKFASHHSTMAAHNNFGTFLNYGSLFGLFLSRNNWTCLNTRKMGRHQGFENIAKKILSTVQLATTKCAQEHLESSLIFVRPLLATFKRLKLRSFKWLLDKVSQKKQNYKEW